MSRHLINLAVVVLLALLAGTSCADAGQRTIPVVPGWAVHQESDAGNSAEQSRHYMLAYSLLYCDPAGPTIETGTLRAAESHLNVISYLEQEPCLNCVEVVGFKPNADGTFDADIRLKHPFYSANFTGFDVRGIVMFNGSHLFPSAGSSGLYTSDHSVGEGQLVNADGFTTLYNPSTADYAPFEGYLPGKLASTETPGGELNGFIRFISDPSKPRSVFKAHETATMTYTMYLPPAPLVVGYAVDASWVPADNKPVVDPWTDFSSDANCPEAWRIEVHEIPGGTLSECGGWTDLLIDVYDWQGNDLSHDVLVECPELFDGRINATWKEDADGHTGYVATIENSNYAAPGSYMCLISKEETYPAGKPWMDPTAYQIYMVSVSEASGQPTNPVEIAGPAFDFSPTHVSLEGKYLVTGEGDIHSGSIHIYDISDPTSLTSQYYVALPQGAPAVAVSKGYAYAGCATDFNLYVVDIDPPESASVVKTVEVPGGVSGLAISGGYAYIAGGAGLSIIDIDPLETAHLVNKVHTPHNSTSVASDGAHAYVADVNGDLSIIDIDPPEEANLVTTVDPGGGGPTDVKVSNGYVYVGAVAGMLTSGHVHVVDVDPPESAHKVCTINTQAPVQGLDISCGYVYVAYCGNGGALGIIDVGSPENAYMLTKLITASPMDVAVTNQYAFVAANTGGLRIVKLW